MQSFSPLQRLQNELASEVQAGTIGSADQAALSSALSDIDSALKSQMQAGGSRPSPEDMKAKIDDLIANEVSEGDLTAEQAEELKNVFASAMQGGPGSAGGPPPGPPPGGSEEDDDSTTSATSTETDVSELLKEFLKKLQESQSSTSSYGSNGSNLASEIESLIVNYAA